MNTKGEEEGKKRGGKQKEGEGDRERERETAGNGILYATEIGLSISCILIVPSHQTRGPFRPVTFISRERL